MDARVRVERYGPGEEVEDPRPGDFLLIRCRSRVSRLIYAAERLRPRDQRPFGHWSHSALVVRRDGLIADVTSAGVIVRHVSRYRGEEYHYVRLDQPLDQALLAAQYALSCVGQPYGHLSAVRLGWNVVTRCPIRVRDRGQQVCASLVCRALERAGHRFAERPHEMMAGDLARHFGVAP
ncbi:MAG: Permuted papain-like amidase enzyme YaeF/YiiX, family [Gaiellaceae bacterium]|nr:Permuted papain-like amidase enzyme YaeF/YiiX, family [Gaiellaceae bacterium]